MENDVSQIFDSIGAFAEGEIRDHNPPENGALPHFQRVLSLNIGYTEEDAAGP